MTPDLVLVTNQSVTLFQFLSRTVLGQKVLPRNESIGPIFGENKFNLFYQEDIETPIFFF